jgi:hypothetical protein
MAVPDSGNIGCRDGRQIERRWRVGGGTGGAMRNKRWEPTVLDVVADRWVPTYFLAMSDAPGASPMEREQPWAPDSVLGRVGWKWPLGRANGAN